MSQAIHGFSVNIGALSNASRPVFKVPTAYGGITIVGAQCIQGGAGTTQLYLVEMDSGGTSNVGTAGTFGTVYATNVPNAATLTAASCFVDGGNYIGIKENNVGAANAVTIVSIQYVMGKGSAA